MTDQEAPYDDEEIDDQAGESGQAIPTAAA